MRALISGGAGFIGSHVADALQSAGHHVLILDNFSTGNMKNIMQFLADGGKYRQADVRLCDGDISIFENVSDVFRTFRPEAVVHLAAQAAISTSIENPIQDLTVNGIGTLNMLAAARKYGVKRFVFSSTSAVYRASKFFKTNENAPLEPNTPYGISKLAAEMYVRSMFPGATVLRFGNVYGPRQRAIGLNQLIPRAIRHLEYGDKFFINGSGEQKRDFVYVEDVVRFPYPIEGKNCYKIGQSIAPLSRKERLSSTSPVPVILEILIKTEDMSMLESELHHKFLKNRSNKEWFFLSDDDIDTIISENKCMFPPFL